jgi:hypothetical protein
MEDAFDIIVSLNRNRILGRLASRHFSPPSYEKKSPRDALSKRLKILTQSSKYQHSSDVEQFHRQIELFRTASNHVEESNANLDAIKAAVKAAFQLTGDGFSLLSRLQKTNVPPSAMDRREVHKLNKLGNYWRICLSLTHLSRSYRSLFNNLCLELIEPFAASVVPGNNTLRHVHAEVQMLVHHEIKGSSNWPRAIGVSKGSCFLCNSLIKSHGSFFVSKAHRQVYHRWTVPDLSKYSPESLDRLRRTLLAMRHDVKSELQHAKRNREFRPYPLQSSTNLHKPIYPTPSITTILSSSSGEAKVASDTTVLATGQAPTPPQNVESSERHQQDHHSETSQSLASQSLEQDFVPDKNLSVSVCHSPPRCAKGTYLPASIASNWLELFIGLAERNSVDWTSDYTSLELDSVLLTPWTTEEIKHSFDLSQLHHGEEVVVSGHTIHHEQNDAGYKTSIVLAFEQQDPMLMSCYWSELKPA